MPYIPSDLYRPSALGCAAGFSSFVGFVAGIYHGVNDAMGKPMEVGLEKLLMFAPSVLGSNCWSSID